MELKDTWWPGWGRRAPAPPRSWRRWSSVLHCRTDGSVRMMELLSGGRVRYSFHCFFRWTRAWRAATGGRSRAGAPPAGHNKLLILLYGTNMMQEYETFHTSGASHWPADRGAPVSVPGGGGGTSRGAPSARRHSSSGTLSPTRGVRPDERELITLSSTKSGQQQHPCKPGSYRERERRRREREWERDRWCLSLLGSFSRSRDFGLSSFLLIFSGDCSLTSFTESAVTTSTTVSLRRKRI